MTRVSFEGFTLDARTRDMLLDARALCPAPMVITQGSYNTSVSASAGTHSGGGAVDIRARDLTSTQRGQVVSYMRRVGFAAWLREPIPDVWPYHVHAIAVGCPDLSPAAAGQVDDYKAGRNGLANNGPDNGPRDWVNVTWESYLKARGGISVTAYDDLLGKINTQQAQINTLLGRVSGNTDARAQYAYGQVTAGGALYELAHRHDFTLYADNGIIDILGTLDQRIKTLNANETLDDADLDAVKTDLEALKAKVAELEAAAPKA